MSLALLASLAAAAVWLHLLFGRGWFWLARERDDRDLPPAPGRWPDVVAVVPARDEADVVADSIGSLLRQDYPGRLAVVLVDDQSSDGTAAVARRAARDAGAEDRLTVIDGTAPPPGWTGKLWAVDRGVAEVEGRGDGPEFLWLTDADIGHAPDTLRLLVTRAEAGGDPATARVLVSNMALLQTATWAEKALIPAFVYFFAMLFPFATVNRPGRGIGAAAGGCVLVRRRPFLDAGGIGAISSRIIDDCALGELMKRQGPVFLGLTRRSLSLRSYGGFLAVGRMVARSAYAQLRFSPILLAGTLLGMAVTYLAAPLAALFGSGWGQLLGALVWLAMAVSFQPMLRFYRATPLWGPALPLIGLAYTGFTLWSAVQHWRGRGGFWKGRAQAYAGRAS